MTPTEIHQRLQEHFGEGIESLTTEKVFDPFIFVKPASLVEACRFLKNDTALAFDCLSNMSGVDYPKDNKIQVVLHLYSYTHRHKIVIKVDAPRDNPTLPSIESIWKAANWHEREIYDLLGIVFTDHPDLRRLLMPEDWVGYPLRKDFVEPEEYHGISTRRESLLK